MRNPVRRRPAVAAMACALTVTIGWGCGDSTPPPPAPTPVVPKDEIPPANLSAFIAAHLEGVGSMEQYKYRHAAEAFGKTVELAPGLLAAKINLAIAMLNDTGNEAEKAKAKGDKAPPTRFDRVIGLLDEVLQRDPNNLSAHFCRGIIQEDLGHFDEAFLDYKFVTDHDPTDSSAWMHAGNTLPGEGMKIREHIVAKKPYYERAVEQDPYNYSALYSVERALQIAGDVEEAARIRSRINRLSPERSPAGPGDNVANVYGDMGKYATIIDPFPRPKAPAKAANPPRFETPKPLSVSLPTGDRWASPADFTGDLAPIGRARDRLGAAAIALDADADGKLDLFLAASVTGKAGKVRDALLLNRGDGRFDDVSRDFGLPDDRPSLGASAGDFDADRLPDLALVGIGGVKILRNVGGKKFEDMSGLLPPASPPTIALAARWMDIDQDGDLDLYVVNLTTADRAADAFGPKPPPGVANAAFRNDGQPRPSPGAIKENSAPVAVAKADLKATEGLEPKFSAWDGDEAKALLGGDAPHTGVAILDIDDDRDLDLVLTAEGQAPTVVLNDRLGRFHTSDCKGLADIQGGSGVLVTDLDRDGLGDLVLTGVSGVTVALRNASKKSDSGAAALAFEPWPVDVRGSRSAVAADLDLDGWPDLLALTSGEPGQTPRFSRGEGTRFAPPRPIGPSGASPAGTRGFALADVIGDPLPDLIILRDGEGPSLSHNLGNGGHWIALNIGGRWGVKPKHMRTNSEGLGAKIRIDSDNLSVPYLHTTPEAGPGQSMGPVVLGLGGAEKVRVLRVKWPDGVLQAELEVNTNQAFDLIENNRKEGSCPVLFTWDGKKFVCLGDFLGGGGLGYLVAPGVYGEPDRDEAVAIAPDQLTPVEGAYRMAITEPMSELAYLDKITLDVIDRPPGVSTAPDERFAPGGNRPSGALLAWKDAIEYAKATDLKGRDLTDALRRTDRAFADDFLLREGWIGYAEEHGIVLDFGDRLAKFGPTDRLVLCLSGYVEYPYSQTNYAAASAGVSLKPPVLERLGDDGSWLVLEADPGYPAGMERMTTLELAGKLGGPRCVLRLKTTMDLGWDQAFVARLDENAGVKVTSLPARRASLAYRGYTREISPDGKLPLVYDYEHVDPAPLAHLAGSLTRFGDVLPLLLDDDDQLCVIGPGDEVKLEFDATKVPPLPEGWTRAFVLRTIGYCKDADPFTAASDTVGPMPWINMPKSYPFGPEDDRPKDPAYSRYLDEYQTRKVGQ